MCIAHRLLLSTSEITGRRRPCRRPVISLCNIVLHLLVRHTALLRRLSSHSVHSTHFHFSNRFLEVPNRYTDPWGGTFLSAEGKERPGVQKNIHNNQHYRRHYCRGLPFAADFLNVIRSPSARRRVIFFMHSLTCAGAVYCRIMSCFGI